MKTLLFVFTTALLCGCFTSQEVQVDVANAQLVKIDTVYRYPNQQQQLLTWKLLESNTQYFSYAPMASVYSVGSHMMVLVRK